ncbi:hypothetical protein CTEN210_06941 [Chaetoceros tenuissimus]|uniref:Uncharacterized protein n=1 Tax=Chaetoceros tenuissimus TaxID=426638 RepID=A0AAD3H4V5_9STRA|nr:hypothetical protein CTEN210_06941 [Chaetoceros tenuissimus]
MAGSLMHASFGLVGGKAMFSPIWKVMEGSPKFIQFNPALLECLKDWKYILKNMMKNPTDISLLVAEYPHYTAYLDAWFFKTPIAWMLEGYRREDPPVVPQLAVPVEVPHTAFQTAYATSCKVEKAKADLALITFYYLLRVGEYTKPKYTTVNGVRRRMTRTKQFSIGNIGFFMRRRMDEAGKPVVMNWKFGKDEFRAAFSKARNNTAPGFLGLPMIYWKAICEDNKLCKIYAALLETAFKEGFIYDRWLKSIQAMLQKKDLPYYMKLRIIEQLRWHWTRLW